MHRSVRPLALLLLLPTTLRAQAPAPDSLPEVRAARTSLPVRIDGRLDDAAWQGVPAFDRFTQIDPDEGKPASQRTEARVLYDDEALYVGVRLFDTGPVTGRLGRRDMPLGDSDWVGVMLDSYHDHRTAFGFDVNPAGVRRDQVKVIEHDDNSWDPVWEVATTVDSLGWTAEYRIPFSQLRFSPAAGQTWGIQVERVIGRNREYAVSTFIPKREQGGVPRYGHLVGLRDIRPGKRLEVLPYTVARAEHMDRGANPFRSDREYGASAGVDLKYRLTSNLTLDATLNPDFGQVEVDPAVVNLGVYETFFQEKRPFFVEGSEIFGFGSGGGGRLFYSRRVGRTPQLGVPSGQSDLPAAATILGAAKVSGQTAGGWSVGAMAALTEREEARYLDAGGTARVQTVEPLSNYFVGRARRALRAGATTVGGIVTAVNRVLDDDLPRSQLRSSAYAGGVDFRHEFDRRRWAVEGAVALSHVAGDRRAIALTQRLSNHYFQRPDADHLEVDTTATTLSGLAARLDLQRQAGEHWRGSLSLATTTPGYEVNDLGFNYRTDRRDIDGEITYVQNRPGRFWRAWRTSASSRLEGNTDNQLIANWNTLSGFFQHLSYWQVVFSTTYSVRANDDRLTRGGPMAVRPAGYNAGVALTSDQRRPVTYRVQTGIARDEFGLRAWELNPTIGLKTSARWNASVGPRFFRSRAPAQYVATVADPTATATFGRRYVFAPIRQTELGLETRLNYTFQPGLSLEVYAQPLLSSGDYGAPASLAAPSTYRFEPYAGRVPDRDFNVRSLRGNAVLRWEWRRGSTLYAAWQQSREDVARVGDFDFRRDQQALFAAPPENIFLIKLNYWLNP